MESQAASADSLNDLVIAAIRTYVKSIRRREIDHAFRGMAADGDFQKESRRIASEFERSDWEAFQMGEKS